MKCRCEGIPVSTAGPCAVVGVRPGAGTDDSDAEVELARCNTASDAGVVVAHFWWAHNDEKDWLFGHFEVRT